jgi:hypothetical protein
MQHLCTFAYNCRIYLPAQESIIGQGTVEQFGVTIPPSSQFKQLPPMHHVKLLRLVLATALPMQLGSLLKRKRLIQTLTQHLAGECRFGNPRSKRSFAFRVKADKIGMVHVPYLTADYDYMSVLRKVPVLK